MAIPALQVFVGFDLTDTGVGPFAVLDDELRGILDSPDYVLAGTIFYNITDRVRKVDISRGKPRDFSSFTTGAANIEFNNHDRAFDPLYTGSPYYGNIVPRREIIITSNGATQFKGWIEDWDLHYQPDGNSIVVAKAIDAMSTFASQAFPETATTEQLSGARINAVLDSPHVNWPTSERDIATGQELIGAYTIADNTDPLTYIQAISTAEIGDFFISRDGLATFKDRYKNPAGATPVIFGPNDLPFANLAVVYGSELLYNDISVSRKDGATVSVEDIESQQLYGSRNLTLENLLVASDTQLTDIGIIYANQYSQPEYRFESLDVMMHKLTTEEQEQVLNLDIASVVKIVFTPNNIGDPIERFVEVIRITHLVTPDNHIITLGFAATTNNYFRLSDAAFGRLSAGNSLA